MRLLWSRILLVALAVGAGACSDSAGPEGGNGDDVVTINAAGTSFSPASRTIPRGTTVRWVNSSGTFHTVTPNGHNEWAGANLPDGGSVEHTFNTAGTYAYFCTPHQSVGMTGTITVQ